MRYSRLFTCKEILAAVENSTLHNSNSDDLVIDNIITDSRKSCKASLFIALTGDNFDGHNYLDQAVSSGAVAVCISQDFIKENYLSLKIPTIIVPNTLLAYQSLAKAHRFKMTSCKIIAITGSSGKTSTKEILKTILEEAFGSNCVLATEGNTNNHIGVPKNLLRMNSNHSFAIIEMGTNHPGEIEILARIAIPDIAIITSIGNAHIEYLKDVAGVAKEKSAILGGYHKEHGEILYPVGIVPAYGNGIQELYKHLPKECFMFAPEEIKDQCNANIYYQYLGGNLNGSRFKFISNSNVKLSDSIQWKLHGKHQVSNASAAMLAATILGASIEEIQNGLPKCSLPGMRMQITKKNDITWINDAYNANPESVIATLDWLAEFADQDHLKIILGDMLEIGEKSSFFHKKIIDHTLEKFPHAKIFVVGNNMYKTVHAEADLYNKIIAFTEIESAIAPLQKELSPNDSVFLKGSRGVALEKVIL